MPYFVSTVQCFTLKLIAVDNKVFSLNFLTQNNLLDIILIEISSNKKINADVIAFMHRHFFRNGFKVILFQFSIYLLSNKFDFKII